MTARTRTHEFASSDELAESLAERVVERLRSALAIRGRATLAVSGGSTPGKFFDALSRAKLDWDDVTVTLVDERCVRPDDERSNLRLVRKRLLKDRAKDASVVPLYPSTSEKPEQAARLAAAEIASLEPLDVCILGMGADGHTASLFPGGDNLEAALDPACEHRVMAMTAPGAEEPRLTLTLPVIAGAHFLALHIEGKEKRRTLEKALGNGPEAEMPIRRVADAAGDRLEIFTTG